LITTILKALVYSFTQCRVAPPPSIKLCRFAHQYSIVKDLKFQRRLQV
jgi:hypothetical protein